MSLRHLAPLAIAALAISAAAPTIAATPVLQRDKAFALVVRTADLNLSSDADAKVLLRRIHSAAGQGCGNKPDLAELSRTRAYNLCVDASVTETLARIGNAKLTALNNQSRPLTTLAQSR